MNKVYPVDVFVYNHIKFFCEKGQGACFQSNEKIGKTLGRHKTNISRSITKLNNMGYIHIEKEGGRNMKITDKDFRFNISGKSPSQDDKVATFVDILTTEFDKVAMDEVINSLRGVDKLAKHNIEFKLRYLNLEFKEKETIKENNSAFDKFWGLYPRQRRGNKQKALKAFNKALAEKRTTIENLLVSVEQYAYSDEVARGFAKGCEAWLNDDRFNNDYSRPMTETEKRNQQYYAALQDLEGF